MLHCQRLACWHDYPGQHIRRCHYQGIHEAVHDSLITSRVPEIVYIRLQKKSLGLSKVASATSTRLVTSEPAWLTKVSGATG
jgi:hypothetical protein